MSFSFLSALCWVVCGCLIKIHEYNITWNTQAQNVTHAFGRLQNPFHFLPQLRGHNACSTCTVQATSQNVLVFLQRCSVYHKCFDLFRLLSLLHAPWQSVKLCQKPPLCLILLPKTSPKSYSRYNSQCHFNAAESQYFAYKCGANWGRNHKRSSAGVCGQLLL